MARTHGTPDEVFVALSLEEAAAVAIALDLEAHRALTPEWAALCRRIVTQIDYELLHAQTNPAEHLPELEKGATP